MFKLIHDFGNFKVAIGKEFGSRAKARSYAGRQSRENGSKGWILVNSEGEEEILWWNSPRSGGAKP